jgi:hypothetical protein
MRIVKALFAFLFATPTQSNPQSIGFLAGNGGWNAEDSNHYRP